MTWSESDYRFWTLGPLGSVTDLSVRWIRRLRGDGTGDVLGSNETEESRSNRAREQSSRGGGGGHMQPNADYKQGHERGLSALHQLASNQPNRHNSPVHERPLHERPGGGLHPSQLMHSHPHGPPHHHHHGGLPQIDPYSHWDGPTLCLSSQFNKFSFKYSENSIVGTHFDQNDCLKEEQTNWTKVSHSYKLVKYTSGTWF